MSTEPVPSDTPDNRAEAITELRKTLTDIMGLDPELRSVLQRIVNLL